MRQELDRKIILEDGSEYCGYGFGSRAEAVCEIVFNTSVTGYQEILSDPSYTDQAVVMAYPLIGNYGIAADDFETETPTIGAVIVRDYNDVPSNFRSVMTLSEMCEKYNIPGVGGIDTRKLVRSIRDFGSRKALITDIDTPVKEGVRRLMEYRMPTDAVARVSRRKICEYPVEHGRYHVVAIDCGIKQNIIRSLNRRECSVTVVPYDTKAEEIERLHPDGVFLSNGPGNPEDVKAVIRTVKKLRGKMPMFGICLGHQMIALAYGAETYKLKFGHRGGNHPVKNLATGKIEMTSQNHSYAVDQESLQGTSLLMTHINLLDGTVEGMECAKDQVFSVQYHPESAPGPQDSTYLFDRFICMMEGRKHG